MRPRMVGAMALRIVVAEDNLLVITDREGSEDPLDRIWDELKKLHRDIHDIQDAVDEVADALYGEAEEGPRVRKPTIIEEKPEGPNPPAIEANIDLVGHAETARTAHDVIRQADGMMYMVKNSTRDNIGIAQRGMLNE